MSTTTPPELSTAAIRAALDMDYDTVLPLEDYLALLDALDDARTERDGSKIREQMRLADWREQRDRAEALQVENDRLREELARHAGQ